MKVLRPFAWAMILVAGFVYITSVGHWDFARIHSMGRLWSEPAAAAQAFSPDEQNNIDIYKAARDATVNITSTTYVQDWFMQVFPQKGTGSGFIINPDGQILTNNHVVQGATQLTVKLADQKEYKAKVLGRDPRSDLALIKIEPPQTAFAPPGGIRHLVVGQKVLAIGNPFGFQGTLTTGVVSSLDRTIQTEDSQVPLEGMIQTDAAINPGNSGGPLLDSHGNVIGINTAIYGQGNIGIGFAMPINRAKTMLDEFQKSGKISQPAPLGIHTLYVAGDLADELRLPSSGGLLIQSVEEGSAAQEAGLRGPNQRVVVGGRYQINIGGDFITAVDGQAVTGNETLQRALSHKRGGDTLELTVIRNGKAQTLKVRLAEAPQVI